MTRPGVSMSLWPAVAAVIAVEILIVLVAAWLIRHSIF